MASFVYEALTQEGDVVRGTGDFDSSRDLYGYLRSRGLTLLNYRRRWLSLAARRTGRMKRLVVAEFLRNLGMMIGGGVQLLTALEDFAANPMDPALKARLQVICRRISEGFLLSDAMKEAGGFSPVVIVLARIGEESGNLDRTLRDAAAHLENVQDIIDRTRRALTYPAFVLTAMTGALAFWLLYVFPQILRLFKEMGVAELPLTTRILMEAVNMAQVWWPVVPVGMAALFLLWIMARRNSRVKYMWDMVWMRLPLAGSIIKASQYAFFFEYLALLTRSGVNIVKSMEIMTESVTNQVLKRGLEKIKADVMGGSGLTEAFRETGFFEHFIIRLVSVGEQTGNMPEQLQLLAGFYIKKVQALTEAIAKTIEPALIVLAGGMFALIIVGLLGPIYDLMTRIQ